MQKIVDPLPAGAKIRVRPKSSSMIIRTSGLWFYLKDVSNSATLLGKTFDELHLNAVRLKF